MRTRAVVHLCHPAPHTSEGPVCSEWTHFEDITFVEGGVWLRFDVDDRTFVPHSNIARIDEERCQCGECKKGASA